MHISPVGLFPCQVHNLELHMMVVDAASTLLHCHGMACVNVGGVGLDEGAHDNI